MSVPVTGGGPPQVQNDPFKQVGTGNYQDVTGAMQGILGALFSPVQAKYEGETQGDAQNSSIDGTTNNRDVHRSPIGADPALIIAVISDPVKLQQLVGTMALALGVIAVINKAATPEVRIDPEDTRTDEAHQISADEHMANYTAAITAAGNAPRGSSMQIAMFSTASIELAAVLAEISQMKKGQAAAFAKATQNAMEAMIDGAHTQAKIELDIAQANASAAFMSAGLQAIGGAIGFMGAARGISMANKKEPAKDGLGNPIMDPLDKTKPLMVTSQTAQANATNTGQMWQSVAQLFSQAGVSIVEGVKASTLGPLEAEKCVLQNAMQILGQMMSKWGDAEKDAHDAQNQLIQAMQEAFKAFVASADKLAP